MVIIVSVIVLVRNIKLFFQSFGGSIDNFLKKRSGRLVVLNKEEENAVEAYCLWQHERGVNLDTANVKSIIRDIHARALAEGEKRQPVNPVNGPSAKFMRGLFKRHPLLRKRSAEYVDRGRINMATKETIKQYFDLLKESLTKFGIAEADEHGNIIPETYKSERVYLADETGWGVKSKPKKVIGKKGASHVYLRKPSDESHKTLMLGVCGNGEVLKPLIILEKSFPLLAEGEGEFLPDEVLLSKTENGSMEQDLFVEWLKMSVIPHKLKMNPNETSLIILDNHGSRFSTAAIDLCKKKCKLEMITYPGHLTHILQGPDVVLNKPISTIVDNMIHNKPIISGNSDLTRVAFCAIVVHAMKEVCNKERVQKAFKVTGVIPFNPDIIDLSKFPTSLADLPPVTDSPVKATYSSCRSADVELHPLVKQGVIPKKLAEVFVYTPPPNKTKSQSKVVKKARIVTSEEVKKEIVEIESGKRSKMPRILLKEPSEEAEKGKRCKTSEKAEKGSDVKASSMNLLTEASKSERGVRGGKKSGKKVVSLFDKSDNESSGEDDACDEESSEEQYIDFGIDISKGNYIVVQYARKKAVIYYAAVVTNVRDDEMYEVMFFRRNGNTFFIFHFTDKIGRECIFSKLSPPKEEWKTDRIYYHFQYEKSTIDLQ